MCLWVFAPPRNGTANATGVPHSPAGRVAIAHHSVRRGEASSTAEPGVGDATNQAARPQTLHLVLDMIADRVVERSGNHPQLEPWLTLKQAAEYAACSPDSLRRAVVSGALKAGRLHTDYRFRRSDIDAWLRAPPNRSPAAGRESGDPGLSQDTQRILRSIRGGS